jgi:hypothetical protein
MQVLRVDAPAGPEVRAERRASACAGGALDVALALTLILTGPCVDPMATRGRGWMPPAVALPCVGVQPRAGSREGFGEARLARSRGRVVPHPQALLARLARDEADARGPSMRRGPVACALIGASAWRVAGGARGRAVWPPRIGTARPPPRRGPPSPRWALGRSAGAGDAAGGCGAVGVTAPTRGRAVPWVRP